MRGKCRKTVKRRGKGLKSLCERYRRSICQCWQFTILESDLPEWDKLHSPVGKSFAHILQKCGKQQKQHCYESR